MKIIDELISELTYEVPVRDIRQGPFQTAVLTRNCGLASTQHDTGHHHGKSPITEAGLLLEKDVRDLVLLAKSSSLHEAAIGMATINSLIEVNEDDCIELNAGDLLIQKGDGKRVAIIGHFPFVPKLRKAARELWVIEKNPREGDLVESEAENFVPQADVVGITGTAFMNGTIQRLLELCNPRAFTVILGGTTPLTPVLFDYGISAISGTKVVENETVLRFVSQGATFRQIQGVRLLIMMKKNS